MTTSSEFNHKPGCKQPEVRLVYITEGMRAAGRTTYHKCIECEANDLPSVGLTHYDDRMLSEQIAWEEAGRPGNYGTP